MDFKTQLTEALGVTEKEWDVLSSYAYTDMWRPGQSIQEWQRERLEGMMEEEQMEQELGESIWEPGDKRICMNVFYRPVKK